jgi:hypothetical protein
MHIPRAFSRFLLILVFVGVIAPITVCVVLGVAALLTQMGDNAGGGVLYRIALGGGILWVVDLICLLLLLAIGAVSGPNDSDQTPR